MEKIIIGDNQYILYVNKENDASHILSQELTRIDDIKEMMASLLSEEGQAMQNFMENTSEDRLNIYFYDETSPIYDMDDKAKGKVRRVRADDEKGYFSYDLAYRYPDILGCNANFRLAHEMGHLMLNPSNAKRQIYDRKTKSYHVSGLMRVPKGQKNNKDAIYGKQIQENAINLLAQLAIREKCSADDIITGKKDLTEHNSYRKCDDLVKLLVIAMRNDFDREISFEQLMKQKIDSFIRNNDGTKEPANIFFYGMLNDSSIIQKEFDHYMGKGAWKQLNEKFMQMYQTDISKEEFDLIFTQSQNLIYNFANARFQQKYKEALARNNSSKIPNLDNKMKMICEIIEKTRKREGAEQTNPSQEESVNNKSDQDRKGLVKMTQVSKNDQVTFKQKIAQMLHGNKFLMNVPIIQSFVNKNLNLLPLIYTNEREEFVNRTSNNGEYRNLPQIMLDPQIIKNMEKSKINDSKSR